MTYKVQLLPDLASYFRDPNHLLFRYVVKDTSDLLVPSEILENHNSVTILHDFEKYVDDIRDLQVFEDDIWIISYPKSGSTWAQEAVWQIMHDIDIENEAGKAPLNTRIGFLELSALVELPNRKSSVETVKKMQRPRIIRSHLPIAFLPKELWIVKPRIVYLMREAKETAVSWYHHYINIHNFLGQKEDFLELFLKGNLIFGNYWDHIEQFTLLHEWYKNMKIYKFEEILTNMEKILQDLGKFLNKSLTPNETEKLLHHLAFETMKSNPAVNGAELKPIVEAFHPGTNYTFMRRGGVDSFVEEMPPKYIWRIDEITKKRFKDLDLYQ
ncbi:sulfotransferase 1B1-like [Culicoides brevitarsis]|uniref:sulfotransferase 1B1-like n=1 Tax=Culicoides brevitarsis TaxID=469753 RepID=UPI00307B176D